MLKKYIGILLWMGIHSNKEISGNIDMLEKFYYLTRQLGYGFSTSNPIFKLFILQQIYEHT